jgi:Natural resistance-associated macrophage protein
MVSSLVAGTDFGMVLIRAVVLGALLKYFLTEGIGRWYMASGKTILQGWRSLGRVAIWYFVVYLFVVTFVFGAAVTSTAALATDAAFPDLLPMWAWAALHGVAAFVIVGVGRYGLFESIMKAFAALKFGIVILLAILLAPNLGELALGFVPRIPEGALINVLAIIGERNLLVSRLYVLGARAWLEALVLDPDHASRPDLRLRTDRPVYGVDAGYRGGAALRYRHVHQRRGGPPGVGGPHAGPLRSPGALGIPHRLLGSRDRCHARRLERRRPPLRRLRGTIREVPDEEAEDYLSEKSVFFRGFLAWMTFPPMILLTLGQPVALVIVYASLGALFLPFLAITLLLLLNSGRVAPEYRNRIVSNVVLAVSVVPFHRRRGARGVG